MKNTLTLSERIQICQTCENKQLDIKTGLNCSLTQEKPAFEQECSEYNGVDTSYKEIASKILNKERDQFREEISNLRELNKTRKEEMALNNENRHSQLDLTYGQTKERTRVEKKAINGANWFYVIGALSFINSLLYYFGNSLQFIFGLGITQFVQSVLMEGVGSWGIAVLLPGMLFSGLFVLIGFYSTHFSKGAFISGIAIYSLDSMLFLVLGDYLSFGIHLFAIVVIVKGLSQLHKIQSTRETSFSIEKDI